MLNGYWRVIKSQMSDTWVWFVMYNYSALKWWFKWTRFSLTCTANCSFVAAIRSSTKFQEHRFEYYPGLSSIQTHSCTYIKQTHRQPLNITQKATGKTTPSFPKPSRTSNKQLSYHSSLSGHTAFTSNFFLPFYIRAQLKQSLWFWKRVIIA